MKLPSELKEEASLRGNEYAWAPSAFPHVLARAEALGLACLGGQFQFRAPDATCEMYWLNADAADRLPDEPWNSYVARATAEVRSAFSALVQSTDFAAEALRWSDVPELSGADASPEQYLCFVAYFIPERLAPNQRFKPRRPFASRQPCRFARQTQLQHPSLVAGANDPVRRSHPGLQRRLRPAEFSQFCWWSPAAQLASVKLTGTLRATAA